MVHTRNASDSCMTSGESRLCGGVTVNSLEDYSENHHTRDWIISLDYHTIHSWIINIIQFSWIIIHQTPRLDPACVVATDLSMVFSLTQRHDNMESTWPRKYKHPRSVGTTVMGGAPSWRCPRTRTGIPDRECSSSTAGCDSGVSSRDPEEWTDPDHDAASLDYLNVELRISEYNQGLYSEVREG